MSDPDRRLGGSQPFVMSQSATPIAYGLAEFFNTSDARVVEAGQGPEAFVQVTQDNFARVIRAIADLELEVRALKAK